MIILVDEKRQNHFVTKTEESFLSLISEGHLWKKSMKNSKLVFILSSERLKAFPYNRNKTRMSTFATSGQYYSRVSSQGS